MTKAIVCVKGWGSEFETEPMSNVKTWEDFHWEEREDGTLLVVGLNDLSKSSLSKTKDKTLQRLEGCVL